VREARERQRSLIYRCNASPGLWEIVIRKNERELTDISYHKRGDCGRKALSFPGSGLRGFLGVVLAGRSRGVGVRVGVLIVLRLYWLVAVMVLERTRCGIEDEFEEHVGMCLGRASPVVHGRANEREAEKDERDRMQEEARHVRATR
jgi:hypothetical protein